jgi:hypothetical protein
MGVSINGGTPIRGWFIMENLLKWMIEGYPLVRNLQRESNVMTYDWNV